MSCPRVHTRANNQTRRRYSCPTVAQLDFGKGPEAGELFLDDSAEERVRWPFIVLRPRGSKEPGLPRVVASRKKFVDKIQQQTMVLILSVVDSKTARTDEHDLGVCGP